MGLLCCAIILSRFHADDSIAFFFIGVVVSLAYDAYFNKFELKVVCPHLCSKRYYITIIIVVNLIISIIFVKLIKSETS